MSKPDLNGTPRLSRSQRRRQRRLDEIQRVFAPSSAVALALTEAEQRWKDRTRPYRLIDAIDEHKAAERLGPVSPEEFDRCVDQDLRDWLELPFREIDRIKVLARYMALWRVRQHERGRCFLRVIQALRHFAMYRHPDLDLGPDPLAYQPGHPLNVAGSV